MPIPPKGPRLGGSPAHERLILANLARSLFEHGRITTTETKAKRLRPVAEKLITSAKRGTLHSRREVAKTIRDKDVLHKLFADIAPTFATRDGGYTRIVKTGPRKGDNAPMAIIELIPEETVSSAASKVARRAAGGSAAKAAGAGRGSGKGKAAATQRTTDAAPEKVADAGAGAVDSESVDSEVEESASTEDAPYGDGSHAPLADGSAPAGYDIKGNADSMLYHVPGSAFYDRTVAEVWFANAETAEAAGFSLPASQQAAQAAADNSAADAIADTGAASTDGDTADGDTTGGDTKDGDTTGDDTEDGDTEDGDTEDGDTK